MVRWLEHLHSKMLRGMKLLLPGEEMAWGYLMEAFLQGDQQLPSGRMR